MKRRRGPAKDNGVVSFLRAPLEGGRFDDDSLAEELNSNGIVAAQVDWEALGSIAELVAAIGVIVSLVYLALQIRQNTKAIISQKYDERTKALREINLNNADSDWFWQIDEKLKAHFGTHLHHMRIEASVESWKKALEELESIDRSRFVTIQLTLWNHYQNMFHQHENGFMDADLFDASKQTVRAYSGLWVACGFSQKGKTKFDHFVQAASKRGDV